MRSVIYLSCVLAVMGLAFWAYRENYRTQAAIDEMRQVQREIGQMREDLGVLRAEWAYLNRPERLRDLVNLNFDRLRLVPIEAGQFVQLAQIDYPAPPPVPPKRPQARPQFISDRAAGTLVPASSEVQP
ncbi:cell division protein FtsL [uncultured Paracoccus sp.]|uniref:cell division protein FtsL n=1 Tax=uncultured Paracoccus sp. TaxID=189685 RepID=UPI00262A16F0|nr:cell division protein FtsL [uncultured Paracoccus sp.]